MARTPDRYDGLALREGVDLEQTVSAASLEGEMRYVSGDFSFFDSIGEFNPRSALPPATAIGQILTSVDGLVFSVQTFAVSDLGEIAVDDEGVISVVG